MRIGATDDGEGPAVLFLHAVGATRRTWRPQIEAFREGHRVLAFDMPGHGDSDDIRLERSEVAHTFWKELTSRGVEDVVLVGLGLGGVIAIEMVLLMPERVRGMVLANAYAEHPARHVILDRGEVGTRNGVGPYAQARIDGLLRPIVDEATRQAALDDFSSIPRDVFLHTSRLAWTPHLREVLALIRCPTLVIAGQMDPIAPRPLAEELAAGVPRARLRILDTAHFSNLDDPVAFNEQVREHLQVVALAATPAL